MKSKRSRFDIKEKGGQSKSPLKKRRKLSGSSSESQAKESHKETKDRSNEKSIQSYDFMKRSIKADEENETISQEDVVFHISKFLSARSSESNSHETKVVDMIKQSTKKEPAVNSILFLVQHLESGTSEGDNMSDVSITKEDMATLLLPWSIARLMRASCDTTTEICQNGDNATDATNDVTWRTLSCCLDILSPNSRQKASKEAKSTLSTDAVLSNSLSQSTLSKLLPFAASMAFSKVDSNEDDLHNCASNAFSHLIKRYRPSVEAACTSLLQHVEQLVLQTHATSKGASIAKAEDTNNNEINLPRHQCQAVFNVLQLIHTLLAGANPKRSFGVLVSEEVLVRWGRLGSVCVDEKDVVLSNDAADDAMDVDGAVDVREAANSFVEKILNDGLFNSMHHMDGFRTMAELRGMPSLPKESKEGDESQVDVTSKSSGAKGCYQSSLFKSLRMLLSPNDRGSDVDVRAVVRLIPTLICGFFKQNVKGAITTEAKAKLQFHFWAHVTLPAFELLSISHASAELKVALLKMTADTLKLVLDYDAYSPSYSDSDGTLSFLHFVTGNILRCIESKNDVSRLDRQRTVHLVASMQTILLLNHRLIHEKLSKCIAFACLSLRQYRDETKVVTLLSAIVKTYSELRQIGYFLLCCRNAFGDMKNSESMHSLVSVKQAVDLLGLTYQSLPSGQLHEIWDFFDSWVVSGSGNVTEENANRPQSELLFAIDMFILFIKSIRTDRHNASELRRLCEKSMSSGLEVVINESMNSAVGQLLKTTGSVGTNDASMRQGIDLCGWLVDLHTRSCFWIDSITVDENGSAFLLAQNNEDNALNVLSYLRGVATKAVESKHFKQWKAAWRNPTKRNESQPHHRIDLPPSLSPSLLRLALHRIHQLHSMIYYCKIQEEDNDSGDVELSSVELTNEAKILVDLTIYIASSRGLQVPAQQVDSSASACGSETLWLSVAQSLSTWSHYAEGLHLRVFLHWFFSALCRIDDAVTHDKDCVLALIRDASFYDVKECVSLFMQEGIKIALTKVMNIITEQGSKESIAKLRMLVASESKGVADLCQSLLSRLQEKNNSESSIKEVASIVSFLASAPLDLSLSNENINLIDKLLGLDILVSKVHEITCAIEGNSGPVLIKIVCTARNVLAALLPKTLVLKDVPLLMLAADHMTKSSSVTETSSEALWATGNVMSELFSLGIDYHEKDSSILLELSKKIDNLVSNESSTSPPMKFMPRAYIIRSVVRRMNTLHHHHHHSISCKNNELYQICSQITKLTLKHLASSFIEFITVRGLGVEHNKAAAVSILLASELFSFLSFGASDVEETMKENVEEIFDLVVGITESALSPSVRLAVHYFLSSVLTNKGFVHMCNSPMNAFEILLREIEVASLDSTAMPLLEAALCSLIRNAKLNDIEFIISYLSQSRRGTGHDNAFSVKVYHLLICCVKSQEQIELLASHSIRVLMTSMGLLRGGQCKQSHKSIVSNAVLFSTMMCSLISRKELLLLSGREIAMICCEMSSIFQKNKSFANMTDGVTLFRSCCSIVSALVSHYPKQLYGCPSPLFGLLLALLSHILDSNTKEGLMQKALEYTKICELLIPHKAQFKKHVVGLILRYIHALNSGMSPSTKSKIMPSIYGLLDMCSDFEFRQINSMIDVSSKALFAPVFQSYQKYYQYHGQA